MNDYELIYLAQEENEIAKELLYKKYAKIINMLQENPKYAVVPKSSATIYNAIDNGLIPGVTRENLNSDITTVFNDGQIHIAKWVRNALKIKDGDKLSFEVVNNKIIFSKANEQS